MIEGEKYIYTEQGFSNTGQIYVVIKHGLLMSLATGYRMSVSDGGLARAFQKLNLYCPMDSDNPLMEAVQ